MKRFTLVAVAVLCLFAVGTAQAHDAVAARIGDVHGACCIQGDPGWVDPDRGVFVDPRQDRDLPVSRYLIDVLCARIGDEEPAGR